MIYCTISEISQIANMLFHYKLVTKYVTHLWKGTIAISDVLKWT